MVSRIGHTRNGLPITIYESASTDPTPRFNIDKTAKMAVEFYREHGFVILSNIYSEKICNSLMKEWNRSIKNSPNLLYRQSNGLLESNEYKYGGFVTNPILNLQSINPWLFGGLRTSFENSVLTSDKLAEIASELVEDIPLVVQSMYFEGNSVTWEHQDSYYLDDERIGMMVGCWIALENIDPGAGRFFVIPKSHKYDASEMNTRNSHSYGHQRYISDIVNLCRISDTKGIAPALSAGDVLMWNALTVHGSLQHTIENKSRSSITLHIIGKSSRLLIHRSRLKKPSLSDVQSGKMFIHRPMDHAKLRNRVMLQIEAKMGPCFASGKKLISFLITIKANLMKLTNA